jgi:hypothetical protein
MKTISSAGITLNPNKCTFGASEIEFWGLRIGSTGVRPSPVKVDALNYISPPRSKEDLVTFLCMMQSNEEFIPNFARQAAKLRELSKKSTCCPSKVCVDWRASSCIRGVDRRIQEEHAAPIF